MKHINEDSPASFAHQEEKPLVSERSSPNRFLNLRTKFVLFFTLILIIACTAMSWFFIENRRTAMANRLHQLGTYLLTSVVSNEHFQYAGLVAEDRETLQQFIEGFLAIDDVVYVVITGSDGSVLAQHTKGAR